MNTHTNHYNLHIHHLSPDIRQAHQLYSYAQSPEVLNGFAADNGAGDYGARFNRKLITFPKVKICG